MTVGTMISRASGARVHPVSVREEFEHSWRVLAPERDRFSEYLFHKVDWEFTESEPGELDNQAIYASLDDGEIFSIVLVADGTYVGSRMRINAAWYVDMPTHLDLRPAPMPIKMLGSKFKIVTSK